MEKVILNINQMTPGDIILKVIQPHEYHYGLLRCEIKKIQNNNVITYTIHDVLYIHTWYNIYKEAFKVLTTSLNEDYYEETNVISHYLDTDLRQCYSNSCGVILCYNFMCFTTDVEPHQ